MPPTAGSPLPSSDEPPRVAVAGRPPAVPLRGHPEAVRRLLQWAGNDLGAAALWADRLGDPAQRLEALQAVCFKLAEQDPRAAVGMAERFHLEDGPGIRENLVAEWAARDPDAALDWVAQQPPGDAKEELVSRVAFVLSASEPDGAARLIEEQMTPGPLQVEAAASLVQRWGLRDAAAAAAWVERLEAGPLRDRARRELSTLDRPH